MPLKPVGELSSQESFKKRRSDAPIYEQSDARQLDWEQN